MTHSPPPARGFAAVNGARLHDEVVGSGHPLVLIHAGIADRRMWDDQIAAFAPYFRVIRYDMRGFGQSVPPSGPFSHSADLHGLLHYLGVDRAHLIGVSMGGATIINFALEHPAMATALVTVCAGIGGFQPDVEMPPGWDQIVAEDERLDALIEAGKKDEAAEFGSDLDLRLWIAGLYRTPDQLDLLFRERARELARGAYAYTDVQTERQRPDPPAAERLDQIGVPTLAIVGDKDVPGPNAAADRMVERIRGARKLVIENAAHVPNMERPAAFNRVVLDFLRGL